jgi:4'-phosphopantetheinyl transferase
LLSESDAMQQWNMPPTHLQLTKGVVHVWLAHVDAYFMAIGKSLLSSDEQEKAARFYFERDRRRYAAAHSILRILLGRYLDCDPLAIRFRTNSHGKPAIDAPIQEQRLTFNLSHSNALALLAFTCDREIGVDVEYMRSNVEYEQLARHSFSPNEQQTLLSLPDNAIPQGFFNAWTRKEAYIKARGLGLHLPLHLFDVSLRPGEAAALLASREDAHEAARWTMRTLAPGAGYAGALCVEGDGWELQRYTFMSPN